MMIVRYDRVKVCLTTCMMIVALIALLTSSVRIINAQPNNWKNLEGGTLTSPAVIGIVTPEGSHKRVDVVVRGLDNQVYHKYFNWTNASPWSPWINLGGATLDQPAVAYATYNGRNYLHVVIRGMDNGIYHKKFDCTTETWDTAWMKVKPPTLSYTTSSAPVLVKHSSAYGDDLYLFIRGEDNYLYYAHWNDYSQYWMEFVDRTSLNGMTSDVPAVEVRGHKIYLVVRGMDDGIYFRHGSLEGEWPIQWNPLWEKLPGATISAPTLALAEMPSPCLQLVVRGTDNGLYHTMYDDFGGIPSWDDWMLHQVGGATQDRPALWCSYWPLSVWYLYVRGMDNEVYWNYAYWQTGSFKWYGWARLHEGSMLSAPALEDDYLCVRGADNGVYLWFSVINY